MVNIKYKLRKILFCLLLCFFVTPSISVHANEDTLVIENYINDYANLIDEQTEQKLNQAGKSFDEETGAQIVFVTVDSLNGQDIRQVAYRTFKKYGIGDQEANNGILFIVSMEEKQRYMEVGTGLEGTITDITSQHLQEETLVSAFQSKQYSQGLENLYLKTMEAVTGGNAMSTPTISEVPNHKSSFSIHPLFFTLFMFGLVAIVLVKANQSQSNSENGFLDEHTVYSTMKRRSKSMNNSSVRRNDKSSVHSQSRNDRISPGGGRSRGGGAGGTW